MAWATSILVLGQMLSSVASGGSQAYVRLLRETYIDKGYHELFVSRHFSLQGIWSNNLGILFETNKPFPQMISHIICISKSLAENG